MGSTSPQLSYYYRHHEERKAAGRRYHWEHREEILDKKRQRRKLNPEVLTEKRKEQKRIANANYRIRNGRSDLKYRYGITKEDYRKMFDKQNGECAICSNVSGKALCVDHNHDTGEIRGLLCSVCNKALGSFKDDPALLIKAAEYLKH